MQEIATRFLARRTGIAASALHNYETSGLFKAQRNRAVQRRDPRSDIRRVSILIIAQKCGFRLRDIKELLAALPQNRSSTATEWALVSQAMRAALNKNPARPQLTGSLGKLLSLRFPFDERLPFAQCAGSSGPKNGRSNAACNAGRAITGIRFGLKPTKPFGRIDQATSLYPPAAVTNRQACDGSTSIFCRRR